jgi:hypothetical protein
VALWRVLPVNVSATYTSGVGVDDSIRQRLMVLHAVQRVNGVAGFDAMQVLESPEDSREDPSGIIVHFGLRSSIALGRTEVNEPTCDLAPNEAILCAPQWIDSAFIEMSDTADISDLEHELLHALGLGHTCIVPSVLATEFEPEDIDACGDERRRLDLLSPLKLTRELSEFDALSMDIVRRASVELRDWRGHSITWVEVEG